MAYLLLGTQLLIAMTLLLAAGGKLLNTGDFATALRLSRTPDALVTPVSIALPLLELATAGGLVLGTSQSLPLFMAASILLLTVFTGWMIVTRARGIHVKCGCFGSGTAEIGPRTIGRNICLFAISTVGFTLALTVRSPFPQPSLWMVFSVVTVGLGSLLVQAFLRARPALILTEDEYERALAHD